MPTLGNRAPRHDHPPTQVADGVARGDRWSHAQAYVAADAPRIYGALGNGAWLVLLMLTSPHQLTSSNNRSVAQFSTRISVGSSQSNGDRFDQAWCSGAAAAIAWPMIAGRVRWANATASRYLVLDYSITFETLAYLMSIAIAAAMAIAALPIARVMQAGVNDALQGDARGATQGWRRKQLTTALIGGQMALSIVLLLGAGVLVRSFEKIVGADDGVRDADRIAIGLLGLPSEKYPTAAARTGFFDRLDAQLRTIVGAEDAAIASTIPTRGVRVRPIEIDGRPTTPEARELAQVLTAGPNYFRTMGRPGISGRDFSSGDDASVPLVVMVNESFAAAYWPRQQALGQRLRMMDQNRPGPWRTVVGVTPNIMQGEPTRQRFRPVIYVPFAQQPSARAFIFVRASTPATQTVQAILAKSSGARPTSSPKISGHCKPDWRSIATGWIPSMRTSASMPRSRRCSPSSRW